MQGNPFMWLLLKLPDFLGDDLATHTHTANTTNVLFGGIVSGLLIESPYYLVQTTKTHDKKTVE